MINQFYSYIDPTYPLYVRIYNHHNCHLQTQVYHIILLLCHFIYYHYHNYSFTQFMDNNHYMLMCSVNYTQSDDSELPTLSGWAFIQLVMPIKHFFDLEMEHFSIMSNRNNKIFVRAGAVPNQIQSVTPG